MGMAGIRCGCELGIDTRTSGLGRALGVVDGHGRIRLRSAALGTSSATQRPATRPEAARAPTRRGPRPGASTRIAAPLDGLGRLGSASDRRLWGSDRVDRRNSVVIVGGVPASCPLCRHQRSGHRTKKQELPADDPFPSRCITRRASCVPPEGGVGAATQPGVSAQQRQHRRAAAGGAELACVAAHLFSGRWPSPAGA